MEHFYGSTEPPSTPDMAKFFLSSKLKKFALLIDAIAGEMFCNKFNHSSLEAAM